MLTEKEVQTYKSNLFDLKDQIKEHEKEKDTLYRDNKEKVDIRDDFAKKASIFLTLSIISLIVAIIGIFINIVITVIGGALFVTFLVLRSKPLKAEKEYSAELTDYDNNVKKLDNAIAEINNKIKSINAVLERNEYEVKYSAYEKNHICVYVGSSSTFGDPKETASCYDIVDEVKVYIDGIEYGDISKPFGAFEVTPGSHIVKIECMTTRSGSKIIHTISSKAQQVKVTDGSVFIFYHWNFSAQSDHLAQTLFLKTYDNVYDFLVDTHQIKK